MKTFKMKFSQKAEDAYRRFQEEVTDRSNEVDPEDDHRWGTMAYGFYLACGVGIREAQKMLLLYGMAHRTLADAVKARDDMHAKVAAEMAVKRPKVV